MEEDDDDDGGVFSVFAEHVHHLFIEHFPKVNPTPNALAKLHSAHTPNVLIGNLIDSFQLQNDQLGTGKSVTKAVGPDAIIYDRMIF